MSWSWATGRRATGRRGSGQRGGSWRSSVPRDGNPGADLANIQTQTWAETQALYPDTRCHHIDTHMHAIQTHVAWNRTSCPVRTRARGTGTHALDADGRRSRATILSDRA
ncbi:Multidrug Resistance-Associated Protein 5 [Manis pentadactyla]|nr:Multidrug Resistance-Associated Protein 5 [Manis pentadactyla]